MLKLLLPSRRTQARRDLEEQLERIVERLDHLETAPSPAPDTQEIERIAVSIQKEIYDRLHRLDSDFEKIRFAVSEGIERTDRAERRIHATIKRARKELKARGYEDPGLEAENLQLRLVDGDGGAEDGVPAVRSPVEEPADAPSSIKGVPANYLRRVRGF